MGNILRYTLGIVIGFLLFQLTRYKIHIGTVLGLAIIIIIVVYDLRKKQNGNNSN